MNGRLVRSVISGFSTEQGSIIKTPMQLKERPFSSECVCIDNACVWTDARVSEWQMSPFVFVWFFQTLELQRLVD